MIDPTLCVFVAVRFGYGSYINKPHGRVENDICSVLRCHILVAPAAIFHLLIPTAAASVLAHTKQKII